jgi:hypothetical protein
MAEGSAATEVAYTDHATRKMRAIWRWNVEAYGKPHAGKYVPFFGKRSLNCHLLGQ